MQGVQVADFDKIGHLAVSLAASAEGIQDTLNRMDSNLYSLRTAFTGEAADAYQIAKHKWTVQMFELAAFLRVVSEAAESAGAALSATEAGIVRAVNAV